MRSRIIRCLVALCVSGGVVQSAHAATGTVTLRYGNWNCLQGGAVKEVWASIDRGGQGHAWGSVLTTWSQLGVNVRVNARLRCQKYSWAPWSSYFTDSYVTRWFSFNGQHTWI